MVEHMHRRARADSKGRLPGLVTRAFVTHRTAEGDAWSEVRMRLETVHLFPNAERGVLVYRGMIEVAEDDAGDVVHLLVAAEDPSAPRTVEHYENVLAGRLDKQRGRAPLAQSIAILMPPPTEGWASTRREDATSPSMIEGEGLLRQEPEARRRELRRETARARLEAKGLDPALYGAGEPVEEEEPPGPDDVEGLLIYVEKQRARAADAQREMAVKKEESEKRARAAFAGMGIDYDKARRDALKSGGGPARLLRRPQHQEDALAPRDRP